MEKAFEVWELPDDLNANTNIIYTSATTVTDCDTTPLGLATAHHNEVNEVFMTKKPDYDTFKAEAIGFITDSALVTFAQTWSPGATVIELLPLCVFQAGACVISPTYFAWSGPEAATNLTFEVGSVDMLINGEDRAAVSAPNLDKIRFNTCTEGAFGPYALIVHEAGHALGMSGFSVADLATLTLVWNFIASIVDPFEPIIPFGPYVMSHPVIPASVMNYDHRVPFYDLGNEPDCSPHPFDIMALFALYQGE